MEMHLATVWESISDAMPNELAIVNGDVARTWREYDERAARVAAALSAAGLGLDAKFGLYLYNSNEYLEAQFAGFKARAVPVNVNYRYLGEELRYVLDNSDSEALVFHSSLGERVLSVLDQLPRLRLLVEVDDGGPSVVPHAVRYDELIAGHDPMPRIERSEDDVYMLYTGGTTGMPKGVMYAQGGITEAYIANGYTMLNLPMATDASEVAPAVARLRAEGRAMTTIPCCPLMHGTGVWLGAFAPHLTGGTVVTLQAKSFDAAEMFRVAHRWNVNSLVIVGDSFARPMIRAFDDAIARGEPFDTSSITMVSSSGVMFTSELKDELLDRMPQLVILDAMASSEGTMGVTVTMRGLEVDTGTFSQMPTTKVFTEDGRQVQPGSEEIGLIAAGGNVPLGYYNDAEKSASTFKVIDGKRYSFPGDFATVNADGSITLLGRGNQVINTAGEKVFPEEVEEAVKRLPGIVDCLVVGVADEKFGQAVTAVASVAPGASVDEAAVIAFVKQNLAGFKAPKRVVFVAEVPRGANGKADYRRAMEHALAAPPLS
jgi:fatty-acyl-CoA synthase